MTGAGNVYGTALYELAREENAAKEILAQLAVLDRCFAQEPSYLQLLSSPNLPKTERCRILDDAFRGKIHPYVLNFLKILTEKGYIRQFSQCRKHYEQQYNLDNGIVCVTAVTAVALSDAQSEKLTKKLSSLTGKTISLCNRVDRSVLGGIRLDYDGKQMDDTVAHRLDSLGRLLQYTVL